MKFDYGRKHLAEPPERCGGLLEGEVVVLYGEFA